VEQGWFEAARAARYPTIQEAARACGVSPRLIEHLEYGSTTAPEIARRIGKALGLTAEQVAAITCQDSVARRGLEKRACPADKILLA